jgi:hypothetical protein
MMLKTETEQLTLLLRDTTKSEALHFSVFGLQAFQIV